MGHQLDHDVLYPAGADGVNLLLVLQMTVRTADWTAEREMA
jgi:hypothetical protein